jgi:hypothetical protein
MICVVIMLHFGEYGSMIKPGPKAKINHIAVATDYLIRNHPAHVVAKIHGISRMSVHRSVNVVKSLDHPIADTIRRLLNYAALRDTHHARDGTQDDKP